MQTDQENALPPSPHNRRATQLAAALALVASLSLPAYGFEQVQAPGGCGVRWEDKAVTWRAAWADSVSLPATELLPIALAAASWSEVDCRICSANEAASCWLSCPSHALGLALQQTATAGQVAVVLYRDSDWPSSQLTLGETALEYDNGTGQLQQATVRLQASNRVCSGTCLPAQTELQAVALHELGHAVGLAHSGDSTAVMAAGLKPGAGQGLALQPDDRLAVCTAYNTQCRPPNCAAPDQSLDVASAQKQPVASGCSAGRRAIGHAAEAALLLVGFCLLGRRRYSGKFHWLCK